MDDQGEVDGGKTAVGTFCMRKQQKRDKQKQKNLVNILSNVGKTIISDMWVFFIKKYFPSDHTFEKFVSFWCTLGTLSTLKSFREVQP